jgi:cytochrome c-type biogenesis protein CcmH/NrfG
MDYIEKQKLEKQKLEREYGSIQVRKMEKRKQLQKIMIVLSVVSLMGSTIFGLGKLFTGANSQPSQPKTPTAQSTSLTLAAQEKGYLTVLEREPNNQTALEGLVNTRLDMNNLQGAIDPLEKLVKLNPDRADYKVLLGQAKGKK